MLRREAAGLELDAVDHVGVEDGEEPAQVEGGEDRHPVEQDQVLVLRAAPHVEGRREVRRRDDAGQHLDRSDGVGLGHARKAADLHELELAHRRPPDLGEARPLPRALGLHGDALQLQRAALDGQLEPHGAAGRQRHPLRELLVAQGSHAHRIGARGDAVDPEGAQPIGVGAGQERVAPKEEDGGPVDRGSVHVVDPALDGSELRGHRGRRQQKAEPGEERMASHLISVHVSPAPSRQRVPHVE